MAQPEVAWLGEFVAFNKDNEHQKEMSSMINVTEHLRNEPNMTQAEKRALEKCIEEP